MPNHPSLTRNSFGSFSAWIHPRKLLVRRMLFQIHLWAGILLSLCVVVISPSGSILVFQVVWINRKISDLNGLIPSDSPLYLLGAYSINDAGQIVGQACQLPECSELHAFLATPE
jgi:hypothetical protein